MSFGMVKNVGGKNFTIQSRQFKVAKPFITIKISFYELNEIESEHFLKQLHNFAKNDFRIVKIWKTESMHHKIYNIQNFF